MNVLKWLPTHTNGIKFRRERVARGVYTEFRTVANGRAGALVVAIFESSDPAVVFVGVAAAFGKICGSCRGVVEEGEILKGLVGREGKGVGT